MNGAVRVDAKRVVDVLTALAVIGALWPLFVAIAVAIRLDSPGPAMFRQERVGMHGRVFRIHKFRSMRPSSTVRLVSGTGDRRVTRVGRVLRRTKLDELPQFVDVLLGSMSVVGPRPEVPPYVALWEPARREVILSVRPGITDPASILLRHESDELAAAADPEQHYVQSLIPRKTALYVDYVQNRSLLGDLGLILRTVRAVLRDR
ncbi:MAG: sugar transferase [Actinotalea sp.]|nr:sugar transferase [Actinotalea sp.]